MAASRAVAAFASATLLMCCLLAAGMARAQQPDAAPQARIVVTGDGSVHAAPDYAVVTTGITTNARTARDAADANTRLMTAIDTALLNSGIEQKDIQTAHFSVQPVYAPRDSSSEARLTGFAVTNQVLVTVRQLDKLGDILDRLISAGATNVSNVALLHSNPDKALDEARTAAIADARRKAELYARAAGRTLGSVAWITEGAAPGPPPFAVTAGPRLSAPVPISRGEDTLQVQITVGFEIAH